VFRVLPKVIRSSGIRFHGEGFAALRDVRAVIHGSLFELTFEIPGEGSTDDGAGEFNLERLEGTAILRALDVPAWIIEGPRGAAFRLGLNPGALRSRIGKLGIRRPGSKNAPPQARSVIKK
jgi:hypothetical protein